MKLEPAHTCPQPWDGGQHYLSRDKAPPEWANYYGVYRGDNGQATGAFYERIPETSDCWQVILGEFYEVVEGDGYRRPRTKHIGKLWARPRTLTLDEEIQELEELEREAQGGTW